MEIFVDIADLKTVDEIRDYFPIDGFTTNPKILTSTDGDLQKYVEYMKDKDMKIFFQVTADTAEGMLEQAKTLKNYFGDKLVIKLPAVQEGYKAVPMVKKEGITVCVTVIHSAMQALVAAKAGADYVAPYVSHIDNLGADGIGTVADMVTMFDNSGYDCKVLGASFRTVDQIMRLSIVGCQSITAAPAFFEQMIAHPSTDVSMAGFNKAWKDAFGEKQITDLL